MERGSWRVPQEGKIKKILTRHWAAPPSHCVCSVGHLPAQVAIRNSEYLEEEGAVCGSTDVASLLDRTTMITRDIEGIQPDADLV